MAFMRIHCGYCNMPWEVYYRDNWTADRTRKCPHCQSKIDRQTWAHVLKAFEHVQDANSELLKDHAEYHCPLVTVDFIEDRVFYGEES